MSDVVDLHIPHKIMEDTRHSQSYNNILSTSALKSYILVHLAIPVNSSLLVQFQSQWLDIAERRRPDLNYSPSLNQRRYFRGITRQQIFEILSDSKTKIPIIKLLLVNTLQHRQIGHQNIILLIHLLQKSRITNKEGKMN